MRLVTTARLRAVGVLLMEAAGLALLVVNRISGDTSIKSAFSRVLTKAKAL